ncbi:MAG: AmmeMemoRadiSam system protein A [Planctomycetes bacterium]|nr:AmmeMemoRadiSam system protein A [Planctomycetota bacterium]
MPLSQEEKTELLKLAQETIARYVESKTVPKFDTSNPRLQKTGGVFVSLHTKKKHQLRGCIGLLESQKPLWQTVQEMAVSSATKDPRFDPVAPDEVTNLKIEISILSPLKKMKDAQEIKIGKHGLLIKQGPYSGLLLPQVATEYKWSAEEFLDQTCLKAGLSQGAWEKNAEVFLFNAEVFS